MSYRDNYPAGEITVFNRSGVAGVASLDFLPAEGEEDIIIACWAWHDDAARTCAWTWYDVKEAQTLQGDSYVALTSYIRVPLFATKIAGLSFYVGNSILFTPKATHRSYPQFAVTSLDAAKHIYMSGLVIRRTGLA